jgi:hypothetical protein
MQFSAKGAGPRRSRGTTCPPKSSGRAWRRLAVLGAAFAACLVAAVPASAQTMLSSFDVVRGHSNADQPGPWQATVFSSVSAARFGPGAAFNPDAANDPGASPSLTTNVAFTNPTDNRVTATTLHLPPGQLGSPTATTLCEDAATCQAGQQVGVTTLASPTIPTGLAPPAPTVAPGQLRGKIYNLDPRDTAEPTAPAALAIVIDEVNLTGITPGFVPLPPERRIIQRIPLLLTPRADGDYGLDATLEFSVPIETASLRLWGFLPNSDRKGANVGVPFVFNPTSCLAQDATLDAVFNDGTTQSASFTLDSTGSRDLAAARTGCRQFPWDGDGAGSPNPRFAETAVGTNVKVSDDDDGAYETPDEYQVRFDTPTIEGQLPYQSHVKRIRASLPPGTNLATAIASNPGFTACTEQQFDRGAVESASCPDGSLVGDLTVETPLLDGDRNPDTPLEPIGGDVWAGEQVQGHPNQFRIFTEITDGGVTRIKAKGIATADPQTGDVVAVFDDLPQVPFYHLEQRFFGGDHALLVNPPTCGNPSMRTELVPWAQVLPANERDSVPAAAQPDDRIDVSADGHGDTSTCPSVAQRAFTPALELIADQTQAAADSSVTTRITRPDRQRNLVTTDVSLPDGLVGVLASVPMCGRDAARAGECGEESRVGDVDVVTGNGGSPLHVPGKVYLSQPGAEGELARLTVKVVAQVGPYNVGTIINELAVKLRQNGGELGIDTVGQDRLPSILSGIPIRYRQLDLNINRQGFLRNPLTCDPKQAQGVFGALEGGVQTVLAGFQATGCEALGFAPKLRVGTENQRNNHPAVTTIVTQPDREAAQKTTKVTLPAGLGPNPAVLQNLCSPAQLAGGGCPANSQVGTAKASSPLLPAPLTGPVYVVSRPGEALPKLVVQLRGLLNLDLEGAVSIASGGRLVTTFTGLPNVGVTSFELDLVGGNAASGTPLFDSKPELCDGRQRALGEFTSHTGRTASDEPLVSVAGACPVVAATGRSTGRASVSMTLKRLRSGRPVVTMVARKTRTSARIKRLELRLPAGLRYNRRALSSALRRVSVTGPNGRQLPRSAWRLVGRNRLVITRGTAGSSKVSVTLRRGIVTANRALRRKSALRKRLAFRVAVTDAENAKYTITKRIRARS